MKLSSSFFAVFSFCILLSTGSLFAADYWFIPREIYLKETLSLLISWTSKSRVIILLFNFFVTKGKSTEDLAQKLISLKKDFPRMSLNILLEGEKGKGDPRGAAERNMASAKYLAAQGVKVGFVSGVRDGDVHGAAHAKVVAVDDYIIVGSNNWTMTSIEKNNEMNVMVKSNPLADAFRKYFHDL